MSEEKVQRVTQKQLLWQLLQIEAPDMALFMKEMNKKFGARAEEIKLDGKVVWEDRNVSKL